MSVDHLRWFAGEAGRAYGRVVPNQVAGKRHLVLRTPVGVVGAIAPWNFPLVLAVRKVAPALAAGCPVILKPASATPLSAVMFAEAVDEAGLPPGVFQLVAGRAARSPPSCWRIRSAARSPFTGSTEVGRRLIAGAAGQTQEAVAGTGRPRPAVGLRRRRSRPGRRRRDDRQVPQHGPIVHRRQSGCMSSAAVYEFVRAAAWPRPGRLKIGDGLEEGVDIGPLIDRQALEHALAHIGEAVAGAEQLLCGGKPWEGVAKHGGKLAGASWSRRSC